MCVRAAFVLLLPSEVSTSDEVSSCLEVLDRRYSTFFFLNTCVFISSLLLIKSPQGQWLGVIEKGWGCEGEERKCVTYTT